MSSKFEPRLFLLPIAVLLTSCATVGTRALPEIPCVGNSSRPFRPFSGTICDGSGRGVTNNIALSFLDLPFSLVADIVILPLTIHEQWFKGPLSRAAWRGDVVRVNRLIEKNFPIDDRDAYGRTPLMNAVDNDNVELIRLLLAHGADVNAKSGQGRTPLYYATRYSKDDGQYHDKNPAISEMIRKAGGQLSGK
jgi:uncharacterized protein YceK